MARDRALQCTGPCRGMATSSQPPLHLPRDCTRENTGLADEEPEGVAGRSNHSLTTEFAYVFRAQAEQLPKHLLGVLAERRWARGRRERRAGDLERCAQQLHGPACRVAYGDAQAPGFCVRMTKENVVIPD